MKIEFNDPVTEVVGDLLDAEVDLIGHQCNVTSRGAAGFAAALFNKYPMTNTYLHNPAHTKFGTTEFIEVKAAPFQWVANMYSQFYTGSARPHTIDSENMRQAAFYQALDDIVEWMQKMRLTTVGFPKFIGCGLAGGNWSTYYAMIEDMAAAYPDIKFTLVEKK